MINFQDKKLPQIQQNRKILDFKIDEQKRQKNRLAPLKNFAFEKIIQDHETRIMRIKRPFRKWKKNKKN